MEDKSPLPMWDKEKSTDYIRNVSRGHYDGGGWNVLVITIEL